MVVCNKECCNFTSCETVLHYYSIMLFLKKINNVSNGLLMMVTGESG